MNDPKPPYGTFQVIPSTVIWVGGTFMPSVANRYAGANKDVIQALNGMEALHPDIVNKWNSLRWLVQKSMAENASNMHDVGKGLLMALGEFKSTDGFNADELVKSANLDEPFDPNPNPNRLGLPAEED